MDAVRSSDPLEATRLIQEALRGSGRQDTSRLMSRALNTPKPLIRGPKEYQANGTNLREGLGETLAALRSLRKRRDTDTHFPDNRFPETPNFPKRRFACASGEREFRLFIPSSPRPSGLIVMLHGCRQTAEDFAVGTNMNAIAESHNLLVAYPHQPSSANPMSCWNWFRPQDQARLGGEAEIVAGLTQSVLAEFDLPPRGAFLAGLSAGGAMAAVLGSTYPALYAAVGIHSGLAYKSAHDVNSAFAAMRGQIGPRLAGIRGHGFEPRLIVFHGSGDQTVAPQNASVLWDEAVRSKGPGDVLELTVSAGGRTVDRRIFTEAGNVTSIEEWLIHASGHAWSGGNPKGSYTDADGPNASAEIVRFFLEQRSTLPGSGKSA
jgi:poly(hydroxyalkanoate) depolymerase family esterase